MNKNRIHFGQYNGKTTCEYNFKCLVQKDQKVYTVANVDHFYKPQKIALNCARNGRLFTQLG